MSYHVVHICSLKLFDYILQFTMMALRAEEALETALTLLQDALEILFDPLHVSRRA